VDLCIEWRRLLLQLYQPSYPPKFPHEKGPRPMRLENYFSHRFSVADEFRERGGGPSYIHDGRECC